MKKFDYLIPSIALLGIIFYAIMHLSHFPEVANYFILATLLLGAFPLFLEMVKNMLKGNFGVDLIAMVAIITSIFLSQYLAGTVILLMLSGGEALEGYAMRRARKELTALLANAPTIAHIKTEDGELKDVPVEQLSIDTLIVVKPGEIIPADGVAVSGFSLVDESALTGESVPVEVNISSQVLSGAINKDGLLEIKTIRESKDSKYEQLIRLVRQAEQHKAPIVRLADKYTVIFTIITFVLAVTAWLLSHDLVRILAVLVVATPCPLILATPIAIISGISQSAKRGIIVKDGGALEQLGEAKAFVFDKTGTLTLGKPEVSEVKVYAGSGEDQVLKIAASLDQASAHILARSLTDHAKLKKIKLDYPSNYTETFGDGVTGEISSEKYFFGKLKFIQQQGIKISNEILKEHQALQDQGNITVYLADKKALLGAIFFADKIRSESKDVFTNLTNSGIKKIIMLTGDKKAVAQHISEQLGIKEVLAECLPEQKVATILDLKKNKIRPVVMIGDGVNDAPALASADVGIAMGAHGSSASSEASDIVITIDNLNRVPEAYTIAKYTLKVAKQGIFIGMGLSIGLMIIASLGYITPVVGALLQEGIDVLVIFNALRVAVRSYKTIAI